MHKQLNDKINDTTSFAKYDSQVSTEQNTQNDRDRLLIANHVTYSQPMTCINQIQSWDVLTVNDLIAQLSVQLINLLIAHFFNNDS